MVTIKEIAELTGVSPTTVQNVIHGRTNKVSKENLERIRSALAELHYVPRLAHETMTRGRTKIIGVVIWANRRYEETAAADPFYGQIIGFLESEIRRAGYYMMLYIEADVDTIFRTAASWNMSGVIAVSFTKQSLEKLRTLMDGYPVIGIDTARRTGPVAANVGLDDEDGGYRMTKYLLSRGYERILFIREPERQADNQRLQGFMRAFREENIPLRDRDLLVLERVDNARNEECLEYIKSFAGKKCAVFCSSDLLAVKVMRFLLENRVRIPEDLGVAGFDDNVYARMVWPSLTTMHQSVRRKAEEAVRMLLCALEKRDGETGDHQENDTGRSLRDGAVSRDAYTGTELMLKAEVVVRHSTV